MGTLTPVRPRLPPKGSREDDHDDSDVQLAEEKSTSHTMEVDDGTGHGSTEGEHDHKEDDGEEDVPSGRSENVFARRPQAPMTT